MRVLHTTGNRAVSPLVALQFLERLKRPNSLISPALPSAACATRKNVDYEHVCEPNPPHTCVNIIAKVKIALKNIFILGFSIDFLPDDEKALA